MASSKLTQTALSKRAPSVVKVRERQPHAKNLAGVAPRRGLARLRYQVLLGVVLVVLFPNLVFNSSALWDWWAPFGVNNLLASAAALVVMILLHRRAENFPGVSGFGQTVTIALIGFGIVMAVMFALRFGYSRATFFASFLSGLGFCFMLSVASRSSVGQAYHLVPSPATEALVEISGVNWIPMEEPQLPSEPNTVIIADLREDLNDEWERLIANAAVRGIPVYHVKQVTESLTGRVEIEHLSENSFGSLIPNHMYNKVKRGVDVLLAVVALPFILLLGVLIAAVIKLQSPGPVLFRQVRRGYRGQDFTVVKFRTMRLESTTESERARAITQAADPRVTPFGAFLRRTRIDELPQAWNILRGEMSWIGPRPEALALSDWYTGELPFYSYRHIVRPGITGWAQVNQGHVADIESVFTKLHYDFYYIKHLSAGLDLLIFFKTVKTVFSGFGSK